MGVFGRISLFLNTLWVMFFSLFIPIFPLSAETTIPNPLQDIDTIDEFIVAMLKIIVQIGVPVAVFFIIYAGFLFVTARGSEEQLKKAKHALTWALIGSAILLGAWVIAEAVEGTLREIGAKPL